MTEPKPESRKTTYERPPLREVSFGMSFAALQGFRAAHYGVFWSRLGREFTETFDKPVVGDVRATLSSSEEWFPLPRVWYVHRDKAQLVQLQPNRFYFNWRKVTPQTPYPRFEMLEPLFQDHVSKLGTFVAEQGLGDLQIEGVELTYTNHIFQGEAWTDVQDIAKVFPDLGWRPREKPMGRAAGFAWTAVFDSAHGKLNVTINHGTVPEDPSKQLFVLELRATHSRTGLTIAEMRTWLRAANELIVGAFEDLTSARLQKEVWKRVSG